MLVPTSLQQLKGSGLVGLRRGVSIVGKDAPLYSFISKRTGQVVHSPSVSEEGGLSFLGLGGGFAPTHGEAPPTPKGIESNQHYEFIC